MVCHQGAALSANTDNTPPLALEYIDLFDQWRVKLLLHRLRQATLGFIEVTWFHANDGAVWCNPKENNSLCAVCVYHAA